MKPNFYKNENEFFTKLGIRFWCRSTFNEVILIDGSTLCQNSKYDLQLKENQKFGRNFLKVEVGVYNRWHYLLWVWPKKFGTNLSPGLDVGINLDALQIWTFLGQIWAPSKYELFSSISATGTDILMCIGNRWRDWAYSVVRIDLYQLWIILPFICFTSQPT